MQNLHLLECSAEASQCHVHHHSQFYRDRQIDNGVHGIEKLLLNCQVSEDFA